MCQAVPLGRSLSPGPQTLLFTSRVISMRQITPWSLGVLIFILSIIYLFIFGYAGFSLIVAGGGYSS